MAGLVRKGTRVPSRRTPATPRGTNSSYITTSLDGGKGLSHLHEARGRPRSFPDNLMGTTPFQHGVGVVAWLVLIVAGLFEIGWAVALKFTEGFTRL